MTEQNLGTAVGMPDRFPNSDQDWRLFSSLVNNEAKMVTVAAALIAWPTRPFYAADIRQEVLDIQGDPPAWKGDYYMAFNYCQGLEGFLFNNGEGNRSDPCVPILPITRDALGFCGMGMQWSLDHPDHSLLQILGKSTNGERRQTPEMRLRMYDLLLGNGVMSNADLGRALGFTRRATTSEYARRLKDLGILEGASNPVHYNPRFVIDEIPIQRPDGRREVQAIHRVLDRLYHDKKHSQSACSLEQVIEKCLQLDPDINISRLRIAANKAIKTYKGLRHLPDPTDPEGQTSNAIHPEYVEPLTDLRDRFRGMTSPTTRERWREVAKEIITDRDADGVYTLMAKARHFSNSPKLFQMDRKEELSVTILRVATELGRVSMREATIEARIATGRAQAQISVEVALRKLVESGRLVAVQDLQDPYKTRTINYYSLPAAKPGKKKR